MKTHGEHVRRVQAKHEGRVQVVGTYTHSKTKIEYRCPEHGVWSAVPSNVEAGRGCTPCRQEARRAEHDKRHREQVREVHGDRVEVVGRYERALVHLQYCCPDHGIWSAKPANVIHRKSGCPQCYYDTIGDRCRKAHDDYQRELVPLGIRALGSYEGAHVPLLHECAKGHKWESKPNQILSGYGCPRCDRSQYRRRPVQVGDRTVMLQGAEPTAVRLLLDEGVEPDDFVFSTRHGKPTFRYRFDDRTRTYVPDFLLVSANQIVEVKSITTLGFYDPDLYAKVRAKTRSVLRSDYDFRLFVVHRGRHLDIGRGWHRLSWPKLTERIKRRRHEQDHRYGRT